MLPTLMQKRVHDLLDNSKKPVVWAGSIRSGKSVGAIIYLFNKARKSPGIYVLAGYTYGSIERNLLPIIHQHLSDEGMEAGKEWKLSKRYPWNIKIGGSTIYCMGASDEASHRSLQGLTASGGVIDEVFLVPQSFVIQLVARLSEKDPFLLLTGNKEEPNHWLKRNWIDEEKVHVVESTLDDNEHISNETKTWYDSLICGVFAEKMLGNEWHGSGSSICSCSQSKKVSVMGLVPTIESIYFDPSLAITEKVYCKKVNQSLYFSKIKTQESSISLKNVKEAKGFAAVFPTKTLNMAYSLGDFDLFSDSQDITNELSSLYWEDREKPCFFSPLAMACGQAAVYAKNFSNVFDIPSELKAI